MYITDSYLPYFKIKTRVPNQSFIGKTDILINLKKNYQDDTNLSHVKIFKNIKQNLWQLF